MITHPAVGIDFGTTYSCIAYLNEHGDAVSIPNSEGELNTPSIVLVEDDRFVIGTEALKWSCVKSKQVIQNAKRHMGDSKKHWNIAGKDYTPVDVATLIIHKLLADATIKIGPIHRAVISVPAQFNDFQRELMSEAALRAGLKSVDVVNEPVAAALCFILGPEGVWFCELAESQTIFVCDLGGGTCDVTGVRYDKTKVRVFASSGDMHLGGIDWSNVLMEKIANQFRQDFGVDPRDDSESLQYLTLEVENIKRSLSVRPRAALTCQHQGYRKTYNVEQQQFEDLSRHLVDRVSSLTSIMLRDYQGDFVLLTGGASRMPMIRNAIHKATGKSPITSLSPDFSVVHGAAYLAGMLESDSEFARGILGQAKTKRARRSLLAQALGIVVRDNATQTRIPHYLIPKSTPLPATATQTFVTVIDNQKRVRLQIVQSSDTADESFEHLGKCVIDGLVSNLPKGAKIDVTIACDENAEIRVSAREVASGQQAVATLTRPDLGKDAGSKAVEKLTASRVEPHQVFICHAS